MEQYLFTVIIAVAWMIGILSLILGLEKMIRIIMANYFIASIILAFNNFFDLLSLYFITDNVDRWVYGLQNWLWELIYAWKPTILLTIYFVLLIFLITKSRISFWNVSRQWMKILLTIIFLPCTIISIILWISIAIFWWQMVSLEGIQTLAFNVSYMPYAYNIVMLTPLWIILPWIITLLVAILILRKGDASSTSDILIELEESRKRHREKEIDL